MFVRAATLGQLTKHIFDHGGGSHPNSNSLCQHGIQHILISGKSGRQIVALPGFTSLQFAFVLVTLIPGGPTLPPIEQQRSHRAVAADDMFLELIKEVHGVNAGLRSRRTAVNLLGSGRLLAARDLHFDLIERSDPARSRFLK